MQMNIRTGLIDVYSTNVVSLQQRRPTFFLGVRGGRKPQPLLWN